jgi:hypothetical protein
MRSRAPNVVAVDGGVRSEQLDVTDVAAADIAFISDRANDMTHFNTELPKGMPGEVLQHFTRTRILNKPMNMQLLGDAQP